MRFIEIVFFLVYKKIKMPDYTKSPVKVYQLISPHMELGYFGHTTQSLEDRLYQHIQKAMNPNEKDCTSKVLVESGEISILLMEVVNCKCVDDARQKERYYIENYPCVNKNIPGRTQKEYYQSVKEKKKVYYEERKEQKKAYQKTRYHWIKSMDGLNFINV